MAPLSHFIIKHKIIFITAILVGLVYGSHHFFISQILEGQGQKYYSVTLEANYDEAATYASRGKHVYSGSLLAGDINLTEYESSPAVLPILNPIILGGLGHLLGSMESAFIISDFLFPALIFIVFYFLIFELTSSRLLSLIASTLFIFAPKLGLYIPPTSLLAIKEFFKDLLPFLGNPEELFFSRFEYPQITYLFYVATFYFILRVLKRKENIFTPTPVKVWGFTVLAGLSFGVLFYTYFYDWMYILTGLFIMFTLFLLRKKYEEARQVIFIVGIGFLVSAFYWINFLELSSLAQYKDVVMRLGVEVSHKFRFETWTTYLRSGVLALALWYLWREGKETVSIYLIGFLLAIIFVLNIQVITGFNPQPDHWYRELFLPVFLSLLVLLVWFYNKYIKPYIPERFLTKAGWVLIMFVLTVQMHSQFIFSKTYANNYTLDKSYVLGYEWLNDNTPTGSVVGTISLTTNNELPLYTQNKIFLPNGVNTLAPHDEIWSRFLLANLLFGVSLENFSNYISTGNYALSYLFHQQYRRDQSFNNYFRGGGTKELPEELFEERVKEYHSMILGKRVDKRIPYELDYIFFGPREGEIGEDPILVTNTLVKIYDQYDVRIYAIK